MGKQHILVVDDEPKIAFFFQQHLAMVDDDYVTKAVNSGPEALAELKRQHYDLMITDFRMPKMDGLELLRQARLVSPQTRTILVTAYGTADVWQAARELETFRALSKPLKVPDLIASVREALAPATKKMAGSGILAVSGESYETLARCLESLRLDVTARATVLADSTGRILVFSGQIDEAAITPALALLGSATAAAGELARQLRYPQPVHLTYFEGPPFDLYVTNVGEHFFLAIFHDRGQTSSRLGLVWLYTRRTLDTILNLLERAGDGAGDDQLDASFAASVQTELDELFGLDATTTGGRSLAATRGARQPATLPTRIERALDQFAQSTGIMIEQSLSALDGPLSDQHAALVLDTVRSVLKNTYQHGQATILGVSFQRDENTLKGRIADDGVGFNSQSPPPLRTLARLQAAYKAAGGTFKITAYPQQGTDISFMLPLT